jgi:hypothetical protein
MQPVYGWSNPEVLDQILPNVFLGSESQAYKDGMTSYILIRVINDH